MTGGRALQEGDDAPSRSDQPGWRSVARLWWHGLRKLRVTPTYAVVVFGFGLWLQYTNASVRQRVVFHTSTNVANLYRGHWWVLITSCLVVPSATVLSVAEVVVVLGAAELLWGRWRLIAVFLYGNVIASLIIYVALRTGIHHHLVGLRVAFAADVGDSYGLVAVLGALIAYVPSRRRGLLEWAALGVAVALVVAAPSFTDLGHLTSLLLGLVAGVGLRRWPPRSPPIDPAATHSPGAWRDQPAPRTPAG